MSAAITTNAAAVLEVAGGTDGAAPPLRVTGELDEPAELRMSADREPHLLLRLRIRPRGDVSAALPYVAFVDLGVDVCHHMAARELEPKMGAGAVVSVAAAALKLQTDRGGPALRLVQPGRVVVVRGSGSEA